MTIKCMIEAAEMYPVFYIPWAEGNKLDYTDALGYDVTINEDSILAAIDTQLYNRYIQAKLEWEVVQQALRAIYVAKHGE